MVFRIRERNGFSPSKDTLNTSFTTTTSTRCYDWLCIVYTEQVFWIRTRWSGSERAGTKGWRDFDFAGTSNSSNTGTWTTVSREGGWSRETHQTVCPRCVLVLARKGTAKQMNHRHRNIKIRSTFETPSSHGQLFIEPPLLVQLHQNATSAATAKGKES